MCVGRFLRMFERFSWRFQKQSLISKIAGLKFTRESSYLMDGTSDYSIRHLDFLHSAFLHYHLMEIVQCHAEFLRTYRHSHGGLRCRNECWISFLSRHAVVEIQVIP